MRNDLCFLHSPPLCLPVVQSYAPLGRRAFLNVSSCLLGGLGSLTGPPHPVPRAPCDHATSLPHCLPPHMSCYMDLLSGIASRRDLLGALISAKLASTCLIDNISETQLPLPDS